MEKEEMAEKIERRAVISLRGGRTIGNIIELDFATLNGELLILQIPDQLLESVNGRIAEALAQHRIQTPHTHDHQAVLAAPCANVSAVAAAGGDVVVLSITSTAGVIQYFELGLDQSAALRPSLRSAEQDAARQKRAFRQ